MTEHVESELLLLLLPGKQRSGPQRKNQERRDTRLKVSARRTQHAKEPAG